MPIITMLMLSVLAIGSNVSNVSASPTVTVYATDHAFYSEAPSLVSTYFNVTVGITNVVDWGAWSFKLNYNTTLLDAIRVYKTANTSDNTDFVPTDVLGNWYPDQAPTINDSIGGGLGRVWCGALVPVAPGQGRNGNAEFLKIKFHIAVAPPRGISPPNPANITWSCALDLYDVVIGDSYGAAITVDVIDDGSYSYTRGQQIAGAPVASFTWVPTFPIVCQEVTCTDTSTPNGGSINAWEWEISGPATNTTAMNLSTMKFHCDDAGTVNVTLTVFDTEGMNDTVMHSIEQTKPLGCRLDLYTSTNRWCGQVTPNVGIGINEPCDALSPDVNVTLFAEVTWNGAPRMHVLVAFEVLDNRNSCVLYRTAETDKDGIARIWFRIPTPCEVSNFGKWIAYATAKIQDVKQEDRMPFDVGYVITLELVLTDKDTYYAPCDWISIGVELKNIMWIPKNVTLVAVAYDDCDVPIGQVIVPITVPGGRYCNPYHMYVEIYPGIHVPQWTYVGTRGKLYVSAFTTLPRLCGVAYCPEISKTFKLEWRG